MTAKVTIETEECIGCGACAAVCEKHWEIDSSDMKSHIKKGKKEKNGKEELEISDSEIDANMEAAETCPVNCIHIYVNEEKKI